MENKARTLFCVVNIIILILLSSFFVNTSILVVGLLGMLSVLLMTKNENSNFFRLLTIVFCVSVLSMLVLYNGYNVKYGTPYYRGGSDDVYFEQTAMDIVHKSYFFPHEFVTIPELRFANANGFIWILSWLIRFCNIFDGYHTIVYRILSIYFLIILGVLTLKYFSKQYKFSEKQNFIVFGALTLFPNVQYITIHVFRDTLNILILFFIVFLWEDFVSTEKNWKKTILVIMITMLLSYVEFWMRVQNLLLICGIILTTLLLNNKKITTKKIWILTIFIFLVGAFSNLFNYIIDFSDRFSSYLVSNVDGLSQMIFSMSLFPFGILFRIIFGLVSPFPAPIFKIIDVFNDVDIFFGVFVSIGVIIQIYLLPYLFMNIKRLDTITILFLTFFSTVVVTTFTFRHFIMLYPFLVILIFRQFFVTPRETKIRLFVLTTMAFLLCGGMYLLLKGVT